MYQRSNKSGVGIVREKDSIDKLVCRKYRERTSVSISATKTTSLKKFKQQPLELITSFNREPLEHQKLQHQENKTNTCKPSSDHAWKRNLYVKGLFTSSRIKDFQKHLLESTGAETVACTLIPGEPYYLKIAMATIKDASKCIKLLNDTELFGKNARIERRLPTPERVMRRRRSNSFSKELRDFSIVNNTHPKDKIKNSRDRTRSRSPYRDLVTISGSDRNQNMIPASKEMKMRSKSREQNWERSRSPVIRRHRKKPSFYWDIPPVGYEKLTPLQYKAMRAQAPPTEINGVLLEESTYSSTRTIEMEGTESIVNELFVRGLLNHLNKEHVKELLECERRHLEERVQFKYEREQQRIEREKLECDKIEIQRERERFDREQWIEREKIKAEKEDLKRRQARSIAKTENLICTSKTTQGTDHSSKLISPVGDLLSIPAVRSVGLQVQLISSSDINLTERSQEMFFS